MYGCRVFGNVMGLISPPAGRSQAILPKPASDRDYSAWFYGVVVK
jgi:hypothetical protein